MNATFAAWRAEAARLAADLYGRDLAELEVELVAGFEAGDTAAEFVAGVFSEALDK
jgi:hypothetical protein